MNKEETHKLLTALEYRREISKLKYEIKKKEKIIQKLKEKIEKMKKGR